jgi:hypothetical protein
MSVAIYLETAIAVYGTMQCLSLRRCRPNVRHDGATALRYHPFKEEDPMNNHHQLRTGAALAPTILLLTLASTINQAQAADRTWIGGGNDDLWSTPANWGGAAPVVNDALFFGGNIRTSPLNDFPAGTVYSVGGNGVSP